jgi:hypothetical protein
MFLLKYNLIMYLNILPKLFIAKNSSTQTKGHHKDDDP